MDLHDVILRSSEAGLDFLGDDGRMPAGHNGPYHDTETPVRNTSHWVIIFLKAYELTGEQRYHEAVEQCVDFLTGDIARPHGITFHSREVSGKDACNGVIGQAWVIDTLATVGRELNDDSLVELAKSVFLIHPFNEELGAWKAVEPDGRVLGADLTLNHQLWFAAAGSQIDKSGIESKQVTRQIRSFLDSLRANVRLYDSNIIYHNLYPNVCSSEFPPYLIQHINQRSVPMPLIERMKPEIGQKRWKKAIGYHSYNLCALAMLYDVYPNHSIWQSTHIRDAIMVVSTAQFKNMISEREMAFTFNCTGFELAFSEHIFNEDMESVREWSKKQIDKTYDCETGLLTEDSEDPDTLAARLYEATRLPNVQLAD